MRARRFTIKGRVQGVWFRDSTRKVAQSLGLSGHAVNLPDGDVEVLVFGEESALAELAAWLKEGPPMATVAQVIENDADWQNINGFKIG